MALVLPLTSLVVPQGLRESSPFVQSPSSNTSEYLSINPLKWRLLDAFINLHFEQLVLVASNPLVAVLVLSVGPWSHG